MVHWNAVKRVFYYLKGTLEFVIQFNKKCNVEMESFSDSNWASDFDKRRSTIGCVFKRHDVPISWNTNVDVQ